MESVLPAEIGLGVAGAGSPLAREVVDSSEMLIARLLMVKNNKQNKRTEKKSREEKSNGVDSELATALYRGADGGAEEYQTLYI